MDPRHLYGISHMENSKTVDELSKFVHHPMYVKSHPRLFFTCKTSKGRY